MKFIKSNEIKVSVSKAQENQISSKEKIKEALKQNNVIGFDIYDDELLVGFVLLREYEKGCFFLWDFVIDEKYQNKHLGTKALKELIDYMKDNYQLKEMTTTYIYGNEHAKYLYEKIGFVEMEIINEKDCHEVNMIYKM